MSLPSPPESGSRAVGGRGLVERVVAVAARDRVVAGAAGERVVAAAAGDDVVAGAAVEHVVAQVARQRVVARAAGDVLDIGADGSPSPLAPSSARPSRLALTAARAVVVGDDVLARAAGERIGRGAAAQRVVAGAAVERQRGNSTGLAEIGAVAAELEVVGAGAAGEGQVLGVAPT